MSTIVRIEKITDTTARIRNEWISIDELVTCDASLLKHLSIQPIIYARGSFKKGVFNLQCLVKRQHWE